MAENAKCFASMLGGCSKKISREHYFSHGILKLLDGPSFGVEGLPWQARRPGAKVSPKTLVGKMLCETHNNALGTLDANATRLFETISPDHCNGNGEQVDIDGDQVERWIFKALCGLVASGNASARGATLPKSHPPTEFLHFLFGHSTIPDGWGLRVANLPLFRETLGRQSVAMAPFFDGKRILGSFVRLNGLDFILFMVQLSGLDPDRLLETAVYRPSQIVLDPNDPKTKRTIQFSWGGAHTDAIITCEMTPPLSDSAG